MLPLVLVATTAFAAAPEYRHRVGTAPTLSDVLLDVETFLPVGFDHDWDLSVGALMSYGWKPPVNMLSAEPFADDVDHRMIIVNPLVRMYLTPPKAFRWGVEARPSFVVVDAGADGEDWTHFPAAEVQGVCSYDRGRFYAWVSLGVKHFFTENDLTDGEHTTRWPVMAYGASGVSGRTLPAVGLSLGYQFGKTEPG